MSLINQVLRDLEHRRGAAPDTSGLLSAPAARVAQRRNYWIALIGAAALTGVGVLAIERMAAEDAPSVVASAAVPADATAADSFIPDATLDPIESLEPVTVPDPVQDPVAVPEPVQDPVAVQGPAPDAYVAEAIEPARVEHEAAPTPDTSAAAPRDILPPVANGELRRTLVAETPRQRADTAYSAAVVALSESRNGVAERRLMEALGHDASHHEARLALTNLLAASGRIRDAEAQLQEGLRLAPHRWQLADRYARLLFERGDLAAAIGILTSAEPEIDAAPGYHALLAALLQRAGHHDDAADRYQSLVGIHPDEGLWWMGLGISLERTARADAALSAYNRAIRDPRLATDIARFVRERIAALDQERTP